MYSSEKKLAVLIDTFNEYCQYHILDGLYRAASDKGYSIVTFPLVTLESSDSISSHYHFAEELVSNKEFDGIIVLTGALSEHTSQSFLNSFIAKLKLPSVSVAGPGGSCGAITIDNSYGVHDLIEHLISDHNAERIACITGPLGNSEAMERFEAYKETLKKYHLPIDDLLIVEGDFSEQAGVQGIRKLIDNGFNFDAVVCADDITAIGALKELKHQEIFVPDYITVTGFDDIDEASMYSPSISTVRQPFAELGARSVDVISHFWDTHQNSGTIALPTEAVIRETCGCIPEEIRMLRETAEMKVLPKRKWLTPNATEFLKRVGPTIELEYKKFVRRYGETSTYRSFIESSCSVLWNYFYEATVSAETADYFIHSFSSILSQHSSYSESFSFWEKILSELNAITGQLSLNGKKLLPLNRMLQEARILYVNQTTKTLRLKQQIQDEKLLVLHEATEHILNCRGRTQIISILTDELKELAFTDAALVLFPEAIKQESTFKLPQKVSLELLITGGKERQVNTMETMFPLHEIVPHEIRSLWVSENNLIMPLFYREHYFGHLMVSIESENPRMVYESLRFTLSIALYHESQDRDS